MPDAKKFASGGSNPFSFSMCVMYRLPLMANTNESGTCWRQASQMEGRVNE